MRVYHLFFALVNLFKLLKILLEETMKPLTTTRGRMGPSAALCALLVLVMLLLSSCNGDPQNQQQARQSKQALDSAIAHAQSIGVPARVLQSIIQQEQKLSGTSAPGSLFGDQPVNAYYTNLAARYSQLQVEVLGLETQSVQQLDYQTAQALQDMSNALAVRQDQGFIEAQTFADQLANYQQSLAKAQTPGDYDHLLTKVKDSTQALHLMGSAYDAYTTFNQVIQELQDSHIDVTGFRQESHQDLLDFRKATDAEGFTRLLDLMNSQLNETTTVSTVAIPFVGQTKLNKFREDIQSLQQYGGDVSTYQQHLTTDQQNLNTAKTLSDFLHVSSQIDADLSSIQLPVNKAQASALLQQFHQEVTSWGQAHQYNDPFDHHNYTVDYEYDQPGIGSDDDAALQAAQTIDDYQSVIDLVNNDILHLHMMEQDFTDNTPWNQVHQEDQTLMNHYGITNAPEVLVVSLIEQTLRFYQNGQLVRAFKITSGQPALPSPPGYWQVTLRESPTVFKSSEPPGSRFWYPPTHIQYAMEYHSDGYFFHDSSWRVYYGKGTNFPHYDPANDPTYAEVGTHGCINMNPSDIAWLYPNTDYNAKVILY